MLRTVSKYVHCPYLTYFTTVTRVLSFVLECDLKSSISYIRDENQQFESIAGEQVEGEPVWTWRSAPLRSIQFTM